MKHPLITLCTVLIGLFGNAHAQIQPYAWQQTIASAPANPFIRDITGNPNRSTRIYRTLGARRDQQSSTSSLDIGEAILDFTACDKLRVRYQFNDDEAALAMRGLQGVLNLERIGACRTP